jgi:hypothetical protein
MSGVSKDLLTVWRPILRALDPLREVGLDEIQALYAERAVAPYKGLATDLAIADQPAALKVILCGARGSGKSTELTRLAREVREDFCVVHGDLAAGLPDQAGTLAVVTLLGVAALHGIRTWSGKDEPDNETAAQGSDRLQRALSKFGDQAPKVSKLLDAVSGIVTIFHPPAGAALATTNAAVKVAGAGASVGAELRHALARGPLEGRLPAGKRDDAKAVLEAVNEILAELAELAGRPPLLLADGLDKRTGVEEVELALSEEYLLRELQAPLILTGPVNLRHDPRFRTTPGNFRLALLYNVPVCERSPEGTMRPAKEGLDMLRDLYERRRAAADIPKDLIASALIERAALKCSGIIREFLGLLHAACKHALQEQRREVEADDLEAAIKARRLEMEGYLDERHLSILRRVLDKGIVPGTPEADTLLFENFIACYPNGDIWFRPHELIADFIGAHQDGQ